MTRERPVLYATLILAAVVAALHLAAIANYFYWTYWWYDVIMHFLTGATLGFLIYWLFFVSGKFFKAPRSRAYMFAAVLVVAFAFGFAWEAFEYVYAITDSHEGYFQDTANDLILDTCGAALAVLIATRKRQRGSPRLTVHG